MPFDLASLESWERTSRDRLIADPTDFAARLDLAWCLFLQALHPAIGQGRTGEDATSRPVKAGSPSRTRLAMALREALKVCQMSADPMHHAEATRLEVLVELVGGRQAVALAHDQVGALIRQLASDISAPDLQVTPLPKSVRLSSGATQKAARKAPRKPGDPPRSPGRPSDPGAQ